MNLNEAAEQFRTLLTDAVRRAGVARFRPIVLTSITTFVGLSPLLLERSVSAQFLIDSESKLREAAAKMREVADD